MAGQSEKEGANVLTKRKEKLFDGDGGLPPIVSASPPPARTTGPLCFVGPLLLADAAGLYRMAVAAAAAAMAMATRGVGHLAWQ